jgi:hypothetical protein
LEKLLTNPEIQDQRLVSARVDLPEIIQKTATAPYHFQQTPTRMVVFRVRLAMLGQASDAVCQKRDLHFRRPGVLLVSLMLRDDLSFAFHKNYPVLLNT